MIREMLAFVGGVSCGFAAATFVLRNRYKTMVDEEVQSVMKWANEKAGVKEVKKPESTKKNREAMVELTREYRPEDDTKSNDYIEPYVISSSEYEEDDDYQKVSLDYYTQGEELYDGEIRIDDVDETVGSDNLVRLHGDMTAVYVRNEESKTDYEIVRIDGRFGAY